MRLKAFCGSPTPLSICRLTSETPPSSPSWNVPAKYWPSLHRRARSATKPCPRMIPSSVAPTSQKPELSSAGNRKPTSRPACACPWTISAKPHRFRSNRNLDRLWEGHDLESCRPRGVLIRGGAGCAELFIRHSRKPPRAASDQGVFGRLAGDQLLYL